MVTERSGSILRNGMKEINHGNNKNLNNQNNQYHSFCAK
jgi:hypothetical protein